MSRRRPRLEAPDLRTLSWMTQGLGALVAHHDPHAAADERELAGIGACLTWIGQAIEAHVEVNDPSSGRPDKSDGQPECRTDNRKALKS